MLIAVINESTLIKNSDALLMSEAVDMQLKLHVLPAWDMRDGYVQFFADKGAVPKGAWLISILDTPDVADALGYHNQTNDKIDAFVFCKPVLDNGGEVLFDVSNPKTTSIASVLSHEICEMVGDRFANLWADGPQIKEGNEYCFELCDPVEGDSYIITVISDGYSVPVSVSNFVLPRWFDPQATVAPYDYMHKLTAAFTMDTGGYMIVRDAGQSNQVFAEGIPDWKRDCKNGKYSRNQRLRK